ncbi:MAG: 50S ribosomal protein L9 [Phycisphaeraceae bacterium]|nr:50S ribosomal protein L9 [Phycisphaeraceae bacterium]
MAKNIQLLLTENVDNLGIVGDVVNVRLGYARNYLLPREMATTPSEELIKSLAAKRADAQKHLAEVRKQREAMIGKMSGLEVTLEKPCNDQGILYGSITQNDLAEALKKLGFDVKPREVRIGQTIKRIDSYDIHVKLASDLESSVRLHVKADRHIEEDAKEEMDFDNEGNLIEKGKEPRGERGGRGRRQAPEAAPAAEPEAEAKPEKKKAGKKAAAKE